MIIMGTVKLVIIMGTVKLVIIMGTMTLRLKALWFVGEEKE